MIEQQITAGAIEQLREEPNVVSRENRERWILADQAARYLQQKYERLLADQDLTDEAKQKRVQTLYQERGPRIEAKRKEAREALLQAQASAKKSSVPFPAGEAVNPDDAAKLLASQHEADRIRRILDRRAEKSPFKEGGR